MLDFALALGADALHLFMLVPVGCGLEIAPAEMLPPDEYERVLHWFDEQAKTCPIDLKATCAPHYYRIRAQRLEIARKSGDFSESFIAPGTQAKAAPRLLHRRRRPRPAPVGDDARLSRRHERLLRLERRRGVSVRLPAGQRRRHARERVRGHLERSRRCSSSCAIRARSKESAATCRFEAICGGCRARAYAATGSFLAEEPFCTYRPDLDPVGPRDARRGGRDSEAWVG